MGNKRFLVTLLIAFLVICGFFFLGNRNTFAAELKVGDRCIQNKDSCCTCKDVGCNTCVNDGAVTCQPATALNGSPLFDTSGNRLYQCASSAAGKAFGRIEAPAPLAGFLKRDSTGASAISQYLSNFVALIFTVATIVFIFMLLWGAFDWLMSEGDKEKLSSAQKKIINAIIGIILFAIAFAIIRVLGVFTGFTFFK